MSQPRPVRIARSAAVDAPGEARRTAFAGAWVRNRAGELRAGRLFGLFVVVLIAIYAWFVGLALLGSHAGLLTAPAAWGLFTVVAVVLALWGWSITYGRTPKGAQRREGEILVRERMGRIRRFPIESVAGIKIAQHYPASFLGPEPTEFVELLTRERMRRTYLVGERFFEPLADA
ncbi:MAG: hypothetical protein L3J91_00405 [Thermoplasmata archaeon]|nr:hypothetical protein [Thermoplasmata archaeon]